MSMSNNFNNQAETADIAVQAGINKANMPLLKLLLLGILAGVFLALGAHASAMAMHGVTNVGLARFVAGCVFPTGLILIVIVGGELFTGNCLMVEALCAGKISLGGWLRNLIPVYIGNFIGSFCVVLILLLANAFNYSEGGLGALAIKTALGKTSLSFGTALSSGILCNIFVCVAVLGAFSAKDITGKIFAIWFPIMAFVTAGFEHCIANMYYIPAGILAALNPTYATKAGELYGITPDALSSLNVVAFLSNIIPVTIGNIIGGVFIGLATYGAFKSKKLNEAR
jgi:formate/nitrite transporter